jgi:hypothetical protein
MTTSISREQLRSAVDAGAVTVVDALPAAPYITRGTFPSTTLSTSFG